MRALDAVPLHPPNMHTAHCPTALAVLALARGGGGGGLVAKSKGGLIRHRDGFLRLTLRGMELHNAVVLELLGDE